MLGAKGEILYVGKARSLKNRVSSYAKLTGQSVRIGRMIQATASMEFITTETETEALLLEANLIRRLKPYYNVLLRDDKSFPYILITGGHDFPQLDKHRGARNRAGEYFGPFANAGAVSRTLNTRIASAPSRCNMCRWIWKPVTGKKPRVRLSALSVSGSVAGQRRPYASGKSGTANPACS